MAWLTERYRGALRLAIRLRWITLGVGGVIGSEFLPHLDEGARWVRGTLAQSAGPSEGIGLANRGRVIVCSFPETTECTSQTGRPDDGTDHTSFFNVEFFVGLKPKEQWRPAFHQNKDELIAAMDRELNKIPGITWVSRSRLKTTWRRLPAESMGSSPLRFMATTCTCLRTRQRRLQAS